MKGTLVPVVMLPRFTSYLGDGNYSTPPMAVEDYQRAVLTFWRGRLVGGAALTPFLAYMEESHDANAWVQIGSTIDTVDTSDKITADFSLRWFRVRVRLSPDANGDVALSMWMAGVLERTVR